MSTQTILVTGAAGFIGSHTCRVLLEKDAQVVGVDNLNDYYNPVWKQSNIDQLSQFSTFRFEKLDICDRSDLEAVFSGIAFDVVIHLAARAGVRPSWQEPELYHQVNVMGTLNLLEIMKQHQVKQLVFASSSSVYGEQTTGPFREIDQVTDQPISPYAATKKMGEVLAYTYAQQFEIKTTCLRFFTVYGPGGRPDMAPYLFTNKILTHQPITLFGDGTTHRDYTFIDDIVSGVVAAVEHPFEYEVINLGNGNPIKLIEFIHILEQVTGKQAQLEYKPLPPGDVPLTHASIEKATQLLSFKPSTDFTTGLTKFVEWFKEHRLKK